MKNRLISPEWRVGIGNYRSVMFCFYPIKVPMKNLIPVFLPAVLGLIAGISHGVVAEYMEQPTNLGEVLGQSFQSGQMLRD